MKYLGYFLIFCAVIYSASWVPFLISSSHVVAIDLPYAGTDPLGSGVISPAIDPSIDDSVHIFEHALVFGGLHTDGEPLSELNQERLNAAIDVYNDGSASRIVVSNTATAAQAMKDYLIDRGIPEDRILVDDSAEYSEDTCRTHAENQDDYRTLLISHRFHIPRITHLCKSYEMSVSSYAAEESRVGESTSSFIQKLSIRSYRYHREMALLNLSLLGIY